MRPSTYLKQGIPLNTHAADRPVTRTVTGRTAAQGSTLAPIRLALQGGLGNQLFQWAFAQELRHRGHSVTVDTVRCRGDRPLELGALLDDLVIATRPMALGRAAAQRFFPQVLRIVDESDLDVADPQTALQGGRPVLLTGYFQTPAFFSSVAGGVRERVTAHLESMVTAEGREFMHRSRLTNSVAVHVRRGDYVTNPVATAHHGVLGQGYYNKALERVREEEPAQVTWFSDDLDWVRTNLARPGDQLCSPEWAAKAGGEIAVMAACRTRVIANSSFSWWGGWLGLQPDLGGRVIAPAAWFTSSTSHSTLIPENWVTL